MFDVQVRFNSVAICGGYMKAQRLVFLDYVPNIFLNVNSYVAVPALSGQDYNKEVSRNLFLAEGIKTY
jgi:hypothetical protein